jgi:hypothetical protein
MLQTLVKSRPDSLDASMLLRWAFMWARAF